MATAQSFSRVQSTLWLRLHGRETQGELRLQAQQMVMDTLGLALCVGLTFAVRNNPRGRMLLPLCAFPVLGATDLFCIFRELKATHLRTLNRERAEMVAERWLADGTVFTAEEVRRSACARLWTR